MNPPTPTFESALAELESILRALEDGSTTLEESLTRYERGIGLLKQCYSQLRDAEQRITQLTGLDAEGKPLTQPFEHTASTESSEKKRPAPPRVKPKEGGLY